MSVAGGAKAPHGLPAPVPVISPDVSYERRCQLSAQMVNHLIAAAAPHQR